MRKGMVVDETASEKKFNAGVFYGRKMKMARGKN